MAMIDINRQPTNTDALVRIYKNELVLNNRAVLLLGLTPENPRIRVTYDGDQLSSGRMRIYLSLAKKDDVKVYVAVPRNATYKVYSSSLCATLAENLQGYGTYRVCPEVSQEIGGATFYEVFFKKFDICH